MFLSDAKIRSIKPSDKPFKLTDSQGLYLLVNPGGSRLWYLKYPFTAKNSALHWTRLPGFPFRYPAAARGYS